MITVTDTDLEARAMVDQRDRDRLQTPPATPYEAWQLVQLICHQDRRVPERVAGAIAAQLGRVVFHICPEAAPCDCHEEVPR